MGRKTFKRRTKEFFEKLRNKRRWVISGFKILCIIFQFIIFLTSRKMLSLVSFCYYILNIQDLKVNNFGIRFMEFLTGSGYIFVHT